MTVGTACNIPDCGQRRLRGYLFCWSHQMDLELVDLANGTETSGLWTDDEEYAQDFIWVCGHGSIMGDCFLTLCGEFPGVGLTTWEVRAEMAGITLNLN
ncbi:MAG: hypothetical protein OEP52_05495 [Acidimicrobiia bacterium]|nr:hypothetical protein [Acidimicrobiia bacterium]